MAPKASGLARSMPRDIASLCQALVGYLGLAPRHDGPHVPSCYVIGVNYSAYACIRPAAVHVHKT